MTGDPLPPPAPLPELPLHGDDALERVVVLALLGLVVWRGLRDRAAASAR